MRKNSVSLAHFVFVKRKLCGFASLRLKIPLDNALPPHFLRYSSDDNTIIIPLYYHNNTIILPLTMVF